MTNRLGGFWGLYDFGKFGDLTKNTQECSLGGCNSVSTIPGLSSHPGIPPSQNINRIDS